MNCSPKHVPGGTPSLCNTWRTPLIAGRPCIAHDVLNRRNLAGGNHSRRHGRVARLHVSRKNSASATCWGIEVHFHIDRLHDVEALSLRIIVIRKLRASGEPGLCREDETS